MDMLEIDDLTLWLNMLEKIADSSSNMVVVTDRERRIRWVNATYTRVTGWQLGECVGKRPKDILHGPQTRAEDLARLAAILRSGSSVANFELVNYRRTGEPYRVSMNIEPIRDSRGEVYAYLSLQSDVTERHRQTQETAELKQRLEIAQRLARLGRIEAQPDGQACRWSTEVFRILGKEPDEAPRGFAQLLRFADPQDVRAQGLDQPALYAAGEEVDVEFRVEGANGRRWVRCRGRPHWDGQAFGEPLAWSVQDITLYKLSLEEKRLRNEQLNRLVQERTRQLEESNRALEDFSYALSHDLRTPLRHVMSFAELLREDLQAGQTGSCIRHLEKIGQAARRMQLLIEGMLDFARLGQQALRWGPVDQAALVRELVADMEGTDTGKAVDWCIAPDLPVIQADEVLLREVWANLLENAVKYSAMRDVIRVQVSWQADDEAWTFSVRDNGVGFDPQTATKLFGMFQRLHRDDLFKGTGIGLALARKIVECHGGTIWAVSQPGQGAEFSFSVPLRLTPQGPAGASPGPAAGS